MHLLHRKVSDTHRRDSNQVLFVLEMFSFAKLCTFMGDGTDYLTCGELADYNGMLVVSCERCRRESHCYVAELRKPRSMYVTSLRFRCRLCRRVSRMGPCVYATALLGTTIFPLRSVPCRLSSAIECGWTLTRCPCSLMTVHLFLEA